MERRLAGGIFISYRREDAQSAAGRIYDRLVKSLDRSTVFFDVDDIEPGVDFVDVLSERVGACDCLVAIIGRQWISAVDRRGQRRLADPNDFVRIEIEAALERKVRVVPVLVEGAQMPLAEDLPEGMRKLVRRQYIEISHTRFDMDAGRLVTTLQRAHEEALKKASLIVTVSGPGAERTTSGSSALVVRRATDSLEFRVEAIRFLAEYFERKTSPIQRTNTLLFFDVNYAGKNLLKVRVTDIRRPSHGFGCQIVSSDKADNLAYIDDHDASMRVSFSVLYDNMGELQFYDAKTKVKIGSYEQIGSLLFSLFVEGALKKVRFE